MIRLLRLEFEEARDALLTADPTRFAPLQGEATALRHLLTRLTTPRPMIPKETSNG
jgi:hypothetical protein